MKQHDPIQQKAEVLKLSKVNAAVLLALGALNMAPAYAGPGSVLGPTGTIPTYYANSPTNLRKFVDTLPGLTPAGANTFANGTPGQYIPVAEPDVNTYPGSNYFIIGVVEHSQRMHSDLQKATMLRSYVQLVPKTTERPAGFVMPTTAKPLFYPDANGAPSTTPIVWPGTTEQVMGWDSPHYLGPTIVTAKGTPVRIKFMNFLPKGKAITAIDPTTGKLTVTSRNGDLFIPVDETLPGAGNTPTVGETFPQNRVAIHLHGGDSPWISDGTPHQWVAAAGDATPYKRGDRVVNVPDMPDAGDGGINVYYPNDQSARLQWYHDHAFGVTRQNAYAGEAAAYLVTDATEDALLAAAIPATMPMIPLVLQDKSFVPNDIATQDSKWDQAAWGKPGDLWYPHAYEPMILDHDPVTGLPLTTPVNNPAGRWDFGPTAGGPLNLPLTAPDGSYGHVSAGPEAYMDTAMVNGVAYPTLAVEPKAYRFRLLNGANDRYFNLSLWVADGAVVSSDGRANTEVKMVPADGTIYTVGVDAAGAPITATVPADMRPGGVPDPTTAGPNIIQFGNETGLLPKPIVYKPAPMKLAPVTFDEVGGGFYLGNAERGDTVIDFSQYAGKTLILYNDSTAPIPAGDPRYDYYTGGADLSIGDGITSGSGGGAAPTLPGFGPNTRTVMQITVAATQAGGAAPAPAYDTAGNGGALATVLPAAFAAKQDPAIEPTVVANGLPSGLTFAQWKAAHAGTNITVKTIQGDFDPNFGRLIANFGADYTNSPSPAQLPVPLAYIDTVTDIVSDSQIQYWHIKNVDADNHPIHFHLFNVQVIGRVDPTGAMINPTPDEAGWKETVQNWPLQEVIVALKPKTPQLPFGLPNSVRLMDPTTLAGDTTNTSLTYPAGATAPWAFKNIDVATGLPVLDPLTNLPMPGSNKVDNYGWEYVFHCHILGHEENDLMRPMKFLPLTPLLPVAPSISAVTGGLVNWTDATPATVLATKGNPANEIGFRVEQAPVVNGTTGAFTPAVSTGAVSPAVQIPGNVTGGINTLANATSLGTVVPSANTDYAYQVVAVNQVGEAKSAPVILGQAPALVTGLAASVPTATGLTLTWNDVATNETGFDVQYATSTDNGVTWSTWTSYPAVAANLVGGVVTYPVTGLTPATMYRFQVGATKTGFTTQYTAPVTATTPVQLLAPTLSAPISTVDPITGLTQVALTWLDTSGGETAYSVERCAGTAAQCALATANFTLLTNTLPANSLGYIDTTAATGVTYVYRVKALSTVAGVTTPGPVALSTQVTGAVMVAAPTGLTATSPTGVGVTLSWTDSSNNETSFQVERATVTPGVVPVFAAVGLPVTRTAALGTATGGAVTFTDATAVGGSYIYQVRAVKTVAAVAPAVATVSMSAPSNQANITLAVVAPTTLTAVQAGANVTVSWKDMSANETAFEVLRTDTTGLTLPVTFTVARTAAQGTSVNAAVTYSDITAAVGTPYTYQVRAVLTPVVVAPAVAVPSYSAYTAAVNATVVLPAPTGLTTALPAAPATGVILNWVDNATFETAYQINRAIVTLDATGNIPAGTVYTALPLVTRTAAQRTATGAASYTDTTATPAILGAGQAYAYQVVAVNTKTAVAPAVGVTAYSLPSNAAHTAGAVAVTGEPTALTAVTSSGTSIVLSWIDNTAAETAYTVTRTDNTNPALPVVVTTQLPIVKGTGAKGTYTDATAVVGTMYTYTVTPVVPVVAGAPVVNLSVSITAGLTLNAPSAASASVVATGIQIGWTDMSNNETGFQIARVVIDPVTGLPTAAAPVLIPVASSATQKTAVGSVRSFIDTTALPGVIYSYSVASVSGAVISAAIPTSPITITAPIAAPSIPNAVITTASRITVTWTDLSSNETGFVVERAVNGVWTTVATVARTAAQGTSVNKAVSYIDNLVAPVVQGTYQYRVTAVNQTGVAPAAVVTNASSAAVVSNIVNLAVPAAPTALVATATVGVPGVVNLTWADNSTNETGFTVQRATNATFTAGLVSTSVPGANATASVNYALNGLTTGTILYFRVQATSAAGVSTWASTVTPVTVP